MRFFKRTGKYWLLLACHILISLVAFKDFRLNMGGKVMCNYGDGLRSNFALLRYVQDPVGKNGFYGLEQMNYPEGEYVFTADITPMFAVPFRAFCHYVWDVSAYTLQVYQVFIILNILLCGLLLLYLLRRFTSYAPLAFSLALILPWVNVQVLRIWRGHYNLSFSSLTVMALCLVLMWHLYRNRKRAWIWIGLGMGALPAIALTAHGYYLPILSGFIVFALLCYAWKTRRERLVWRRSVAVAIAAPLVSLALSFAVLKVADGYLSQRSDKANGFDWSRQKVQIPSLYSAYSFYTLPFPVHYSDRNDEPEMAGYLGNIGLYTLLFIGIGAVASKGFRRRVHGLHKEFFADPLRASLAVAGLISISMSLGIRYVFSTAEANYTFDNWLNPLVYVGMLTKKIEQFRSMARFFFPAYFAFYVYIIWLLTALCRTYGRRARIAVGAGIALFGGLELTDFVDAFQGRCHGDNIFAQAPMRSLRNAPVHYQDYQAILTFPFYMVGSEDYAYTIDDDLERSDYDFQLSYASHLPLINTKLARTLPAHTHAKYSMLALDSLWPEERRLYNAKPVLVVADREKMADKAFERFAGNDSSRNFLRKSNEFIYRHAMMLVARDGKLDYYRWYPLQDSALK